MGGHLYRFFVRTLTRISRLFAHDLHILIKKFNFGRDTDGTKSQKDPDPKPGDDPDSGEGDGKASPDQEISILV